MLSIMDALPWQVNGNIVTESYKRSENLGNLAWQDSAVHENLTKTPIIRT